MRSFFFISLVVVAQAVAAQNCESVIALSKTANVVIEDQQSIETAAANFCNAYSKSSSSGGSASGGIGYGPLSVSFGSSNVDAASVASRYCSAQDSSRARADAYRKYVESIAPDAYRAYETCVKYSQLDLKVSLDPATILPDEFTIVALYASKAKNATTSVAFDASSDVACAWVGNSAQQLSLVSGTAVALKCKRTDSGRKSYVSVFSPALAIDPINIPWGAYTKQGIPFDLVASLQARTSVLETYVTDLRARLGNVEARKVFTSAKPSLSNSKPWTQTGAKSPKTCGDAYVMIGFDQNGDVACATIELVP